MGDHLNQAQSSRDSKKRQWGMYNTPDPKAAWRAYQPPRRQVPARKRASAMDTEAMTVLMDADPLKDEQITNARRTVVRQSLKECDGDQDKAAAMARETMLMLGIHPKQGSHPIMLTGVTTLPNPHHTVGDAKKRRPVTQK